MDFKLKSPCKECPFRRDVPAYLRPGRMDEIVRSISERGESFPCHKTLWHDDDGERVRSSGENFCAGALIFLEHIERPSQMMRIGERLGVYDSRHLKNHDQVFDNIEDLLDHFSDAS